MNKYYKILKKKNCKMDDLVLEVVKNKLIKILGNDENFTECDAHLNEKNELVLNPNYQFIKINKKQVEQIKKRLEAYLPGKSPTRIDTYKP
jgi:cbb3-type cytochrome oxidase cytochrome c subunit